MKTFFLQIANCQEPIAFYASSHLSQCFSIFLIAVSSSINEQNNHENNFTILIALSAASAARSAKFPIVSSRDIGACEILMILSIPCSYTASAPSPIELTIAITENKIFHLRQYDLFLMISPLLPHPNACKTPEQLQLLSGFRSELR